MKHVLDIALQLHEPDILNMTDKILAYQSKHIKKFTEKALHTHIF